MKQLFYGQLDLNKLYKIAKEHPEITKKANFKDGEHTLIYISLFEKEADKFGNTACLKASVNKDAQREGINYFIGDLKESKPREAQPREAQPRQSFDNPLPPIGEDLFPWEK